MPAFVAPLMLVVSCSLLLVFWFEAVDATFDGSVFALEANTNKYVFFIGTFTYVMLMHATSLFI